MYAVRIEFTELFMIVLLLCDNTTLNEINDQL